MATSTTNFGWTVPSDTDLVKDGAAAIRTALGGVDTSFVDLKGGTTGQVLAKATGTDLDFTWVAQDDSNAIQNAIVDAKGDLIAASAADTPARLAVGTNGQVLTADSTAGTGLAWTTISSGGATLLSTTTLSGTSTTISSISGSYKDLIIQVYGMRYDTGNASFGFYTNGSGYNAAQAGAIYFDTTPGTSNIVGSKGGTMTLTYSQNPDRNADSNYWTIVLPQYATTDVRKTCNIFGAYTSTATTYTAITAGGGYYTSSGVAVSSITFPSPAGSFAAGTVKIYGVN